MGEVRRARPAVYETTTSRAVLGLGCGALTGGMLTSSFMFVAPLFQRGSNLVPVIQSISSIPIVGLIASWIWLAGLFYFGVGPWAILHRYGRRSWRSAILLGAAVPFTVAMFVKLMEGHQTTIAAASGALFVVPGIIVALVIWRIAYRRAPASAG